MWHNLYSSVSKMFENMPQRHLRNLQKCNNLVVAQETGSWHDHKLKKMDLGISDSFVILLDTLSHFVHLLNDLVRWNLVKTDFCCIW